jgi:hypothetical protein
MFDERGQGLIIRGARAQTDKNDRRVFLARTDAYTLLRRSLEAYRTTAHSTSNIPHESCFTVSSGVKLVKKQRF